MPEIVVLPTTLEGIVAKTAIRFLGVDSRKVDDVIDEALAEIGEFAGVDRSYIFQQIGDGFMTNTHEWCAENIEPMIGHLQAVPVDVYPWFWDQIRKRRTVHVPRVSELPTAAERDRRNLLEQGVRSVAAIPMISSEDQLVGFIGFDAVNRAKNWSGHDLTLLRSVSDMFVHALEHQAADQRMQDLIESRDEFVASVSHELRTPLTVILGLAAEMFTDFDRFDTGELHEFAGLIAEQSTEVARIVEDLLVVARADIGQVSISSRPIDLLDALESVVRPLPPRYAGRIERLKARPAMVLGDPLRVRQILRNLVANALKYGTERVYFSLDTGAEWVWLSVHDDGQGVDESQVETVFSPYFRGDGRGTQPGSMGIGLTVSRFLARAIRGDIECIPGSPGTFEVRLPVP